MPSITAKRKCPDLIFVKPRFDAYKAISLQIREIFAAYTPIIELLSLDEAYLDVTENLKGISSATQIAEEIPARISRRNRAHGFGQRLLIPSFLGKRRRPNGRGDGGAGSGDRQDRLYPRATALHFPERRPDCRGGAVSAYRGPRPHDLRVSQFTLTFQQKNVALIFMGSSREYVGVIGRGNHGPVFT